MHAISFQTSLDGINWAELKATLAADNFDNGRTPAQYRLSAENSCFNCFALCAGRVIGTVRVLSDGVCNAYVVDVWTLSSFRGQGIATQMMSLALERLAGQHVYLFTDDAQPFYAKLGFQPQGVGLGRSMGQWLNNASRTLAE